MNIGKNATRDLRHDATSTVSNKSYSDGIRLVNPHKASKIV